MPLELKGSPVSVIISVGNGSPRNMNERTVRLAQIAKCLPGNSRLSSMSSKAGGNDVGSIRLRKIFPARVDHCEGGKGRSLQQ